MSDPQPAEVVSPELRELRSMLRLLGFDQKYNVVENPERPGQFHMVFGWGAERGSRIYWHGEAHGFTSAEAKEWMLLRAALPPFGSERVRSTSSGTVTIIEEDQ